LIKESRIVSKMLVFFGGAFLARARVSHIALRWLRFLSRVHPYLEPSFLPNSSVLARVLNDKDFSCRVTSTGAIHFYCAEHVLIFAGCEHSKRSLNSNYNNYLFLSSGGMASLVDYRLSTKTLEGCRYYQMERLSCGATDFSIYADSVKGEWTTDQFQYMDFTSGLSFVRSFCSVSVNLPKAQPGYVGLMHGDLTDENLMVNGDGRTVLIDLDRLSLNGAQEIDAIHKEVNSREKFESVSWLQFIHQYFFIETPRSENQNNLYWAYFLYRVGCESQGCASRRYKHLIRLAVGKIVARRYSVFVFVAPAGVTGGVGAVVSDLSETVNSICGREVVKIVSSFWGLQAVQNVTLVHSHGLWSLVHVWAFLYSCVYRVPYIISPHGMLDPWALSHKKWKKKAASLLYQSFVLKKASGIIVNSDREAVQVSALLPKQRIITIANGVKFSEYVQPNRSGEISGRALFLSRINPVKGVRELLFAWSKSKAVADYNIYLDIYGNSDDEQYMAGLLDLQYRLGLCDKVSFKGGVYGAEKWKVYEEHDFFILPSLGENFAIVVAEALYVGLPVITTKWTPWSDLERMGFGFQADNLCDDLVRVIDECIERLFMEGRDLSSFSRIYIDRTYSWANIGHEYLQTYLDFEKIIVDVGRGN